MKILVLGAGRSAGFLIEYLSTLCFERRWKLTVCDQNFDRLQRSFTLSDEVELKRMDLTDTEALYGVISDHGAVVSLLPPAMHLLVARLGIEIGVSVFTASYISDSMRELDASAREKGVLLMNELGLDPGIDHLSANQIFDAIHAENQTLSEEKKWSISSFESHCGGLVFSEDCLDNPWGYKFSWNPTNVILAGQGGDSIYREDGQVKRVPPASVFSVAESIDIDGLGWFDVYPNRDSLGYSSIYGLDTADTLLRGTLRRNGYCAAWQELIRAGFTNNQLVLGPEQDCASKVFEFVSGYPSRSAWLDSLLKAGVDSEVLTKLRWLPLDDDAFWVNRIERDTQWFAGKTAAQFLEKLLLECWKLEDGDRDEVVMFHRLRLRNGLGEERTMTSTLQVIGEGGDRTAMAKTVGLPLAIGLVKYLDGSKEEVGVHLPWGKRWYGDILPELEKYGIRFIERIIEE